MNDLLKLAIDGHGMRRWEQISRFRAVASITGAIWAMKRKPNLLDDVVLEGETRYQRLLITPFPRPGRYSTWEPHRQTSETTDGVLAAERREPAASFAGLTRRSPWDDLQVAYFASEANWNYLTAPFILARSDFATEETGPWHKGVAQPVGHLPGRAPAAGLAGATGVGVPERMPYGEPDDPVRDQSDNGPEEEDHVVFSRHVRTLAGQPTEPLG